MSAKIFFSSILASFVAGLVVQHALPYRPASPEETPAEATASASEDSPFDPDLSATTAVVTVSVDDGIGASTVAAPVTSPATQRQVVDTEATDPTMAEQIEPWRKRFAELLAHCGERGKATDQLAGELDQAYYGLVASEFEKSAGLSGAERQDYLSALEMEIHHSAGSVLRALGVEPAWPEVALERSFEAVSAETQYADLDLSNAQRVAVMKLDQERVKRLTQLLATTGLGTDADQRAQEELVPWYESQMRLILGTEPEAE